MENTTYRVGCMCFTNNTKNIDNQQCWFKWFMLILPLQFFLCIGIVDAVLVVDVAAAVIAVVAYLFTFFFNALVDTQNASKQDVPLIKKL